MRRQWALVQSVKPESLDALLRKMMEEVSGSVQLLSERCGRLEEGLAHLQSADLGAQAEQRRTEQLEKMAPWREEVDFEGFSVDFGVISGDFG